jgi:hypothetical protein
VNECVGDNDDGEYTAIERNISAVATEGQYVFEISFNQ